MLVLTRRQSESIIIAGNIKITVVSVGPGRVKLGIEAPPDVRVDRQEIHDKIERNADVLASVVGASPPSDGHGTMVGGPDTAVIVAATPAEGEISSGTSVESAKPPMPLNSISKFRPPRKPR